MFPLPATHVRLLEQWQWEDEAVVVDERRSASWGLAYHQTQESAVPGVGGRPPLNASTLQQQLA